MTHDSLLSFQALRMGMVLKIKVCGGDSNSTFFSAR